jgi:hypothetical protein
MAKAIVSVMHGANRQMENEFELKLNITYFGSDVDSTAEIQGPHEVFSGPINVSSSATQIETQIRAAVDTHAATKNLTISNNAVLFTGLTFI